MVLLGGRIGRHDGRVVRGRKRPREPASVPELPGGFRRTLECWERLRPALEAGADPAAEIDARIRELERIFAPYDAIHLLGQFAGSEWAFRQPDEYVESEETGAAYVVEIVAAILARRPSRAGEQRVTPFIDARVLEPSRELVHEIIMLEGLRRGQRAMVAQSGALGAARRRAAIQHLMLRAPGWPYQENDVLGDLFERDDLARRLHEALGFTAANAVACVEAVASLVPTHIGQLMEDSQDSRLPEALAWASEVVAVREGAGPRAVREMALASLWALTHLGDALCFTIEEVSANSGVPGDVAAAVVAALAVPFGQAEDDVFKLAETIRARPYLEVGNDTYFPTVPGNDTWALRGVLEGAVAGEGYARHRGRWLERKAGERLAAALVPDEMHFEVGLVSAHSGERIGELDALLRYGDTVIVIEAKGAAQRISAKRGGEALIDFLEATLTKAGEQAALAKRALTPQVDIGLTTSTGARLTLGAEVREVHPIVVTLDDISSIAPALWELAGTRVLPADVTIPWLINWYQLDLVCDLVEWPAQLVHFLRRRSRMNDLGRLHAVDELDWFMLYLNEGLYFEEDEHLRRNEEVRYLSQTDELDAWVLWKEGLRSTPASKPRQSLDGATERLLDFLTEVRPPGWIPAGCAVLEMSSETREELHAQIQEARQRAARRGVAQRGTLVFGEAIRPFMVLWVVAPDEGRPVLQDLLRNLVDERVAQHQLQSAVAFGVLVSSPRPVDALLVLEPAPWSAS